MFNAEKLAKWSGGVWHGGCPQSIGAITNNTKTLSRGDLYVAIKGARFDGHTFVRDAFALGACGALIEASALDELAELGNLLVVDESVKALGMLARGYRDEIDPIVIGVTGSVGKTTVKEMLASIVDQVMPTAKTRGNWNNEIGLPLSLLSMKSDTEAGVFEVGMNHPGEIESLCCLLRPQLGIVTAIGPVHLEFFDSVKCIAEEKGGLLRALPKDGHAVLWKDDPFYEVLRACAGCRVSTVSLKTRADYVVEYMSDENMLRIHEQERGEFVDVPWRWPGEHHALNAGYAVAGARGMGVDWESVASGLQAYRPLSMRWEEMEIGGIHFINDAYNANPLSMRAALKAFAETAVAGGKWLVLGSMFELGEHGAVEHYKLGEDVARRGDWCGVLLVGDFANEMERGLLSGGFDGKRIWRFKEAEQCLDLLRENLKEGDGVLLKASRGVALERVINGIKTKEESR